MQSIGKIAAGVFVGNAAFALVAWAIVWTAMEAAESNAAIAGVEASGQASEARLQEACERYRAHVPKDQRDPSLCPE